jgi:hypothetical protein
MKNNIEYIVAYAERFEELAKKAGYSILKLVDIPQVTRNEFVDNHDGMSPEGIIHNIALSIRDGKDISDVKPEIMELSEEIGIPSRDILKCIYDKLTSWKNEADQDE